MVRRICIHSSGCFSHIWLLDKISVFPFFNFQTQFSWVRKISTQFSHSQSLSLFFLSHSSLLQEISIRKVSSLSFVLGEDFDFAKETHYIRITHFFGGREVFVSYVTCWWMKLVRNENFFGDCEVSGCQKFVKFLISKVGQTSFLSQQVKLRFA